MNNDKKSLWSRTNLPDQFGTILLVFTFVLAICPWFSGLDFGVLKIPKMSVTIIDPLKFIGPILFILMIILFIPFKQKSEIRPVEAIRPPEPKQEIIDTSTKIRFLKIGEPEPVSMVNAIEKLEKGENNIKIDWPQDVLDSQEKILSLISQLNDYQNSESVFHGHDPGKIAEHLDHFKKMLSISEAIMMNIEKRLPLMWQGIGNYFFREKALTNLLKIASVDLANKLAGQILFEFPDKNDWIGSEANEWVEFKNRYGDNFEKASNARFAKLFNIDEPIYSAEVMNISGHELVRYAYGSKSHTLEAFDYSSSSRPIINGWFGNYLVPQVEYFLAEQGDVKTIIRYDERADINKIRDANYQEISPYQNE